MVKWRKGVWLVILILIVQMAIPGSRSLIINQIGKEYVEKSNLGNTLYVGGTGPGNYSTIQDALENTSDGDIIYVYNGTYFAYSDDRIIVTNSITLIGENRNNTIICGYNENDVMTITTPESVTVTGFTIKGSGNENVDAGLQIYSSYNNVYNNNFKDNRKGIILYVNSHNCNIYDNYFADNFQGVDVESNNNNIYNNIFYSNRFGIVIGQRKNNILNNSFQENGDGVHLSLDADYNDIFNNNFMGNTEGIHISSSSNNDIFSNNFTSNNNNGIILDGRAAKNKIVQNFFSKNKRGIKIGYDDNIVEKNLIKDSGKDGILISYGSNNKITRNIITNCPENGICIGDPENIVSYNEIASNGVGVYIINAKDNTITCNNFIDNDASFIFPFKELRTIRNNWEMNYWDSLQGTVKIIFGILEWILFSWRDRWNEYHEIAIYPPWLNIDWNPASEPYDI